MIACDRREIQEGEKEKEEEEEEEAEEEKGEEGEEEEETDTPGTLVKVSSPQAHKFETCATSGTTIRDPIP